MEDGTSKEGALGPEKPGKGFRCTKIYLSQPEHTEVLTLAKEHGFSSVGLFIKSYLLKNYAQIREERITKAKQYLELSLAYHFTDSELASAKQRLLR